jgi:hypothetical protein
MIDDFYIISYEFVPVIVIFPDLNIKKVTKLSPILSLAFTPGYLSGWKLAIFHSYSNVDFFSPSMISSVMLFLIPTYLLITCNNYFCLIVFFGSIEFLYFVSILAFINAILISLILLFNNYSKNIGIHFIVDIVLQPVD